MKNKLIISEFFTSIQGESSYAGMPCFFVRLAGCNLDCSYCDTEYAQNAADGTEYSLDEIVAKATASEISVVEITGGEPLLQKDVIGLCNLLLESNFKVLMETNGSLPISSVPKEVIKILDCKCPSSRESEKMDFENFDLLTEADEVKFVMSDRADYEYARGVIRKYDLNKKVDNVLFSPITSNPNLAAKMADWILEDKLTVRMQLQMHKVIWSPDERGR